MSEQSQFIEVFLDLLPNQPKNEQSRESFRQLLRQRFEAVLADAVERMWDLPPIVLMKPQSDYLKLLLEARDLYIIGHFYSCVAMCGIVGERLIKDVFRISILVQKDGSPQTPSDSAFDQLERVEVNGIVRFLKETSLLTATAEKAAESLYQLRNKYPTHAAKPHSQMP